MGSLKLQYQKATKKTIAEAALQKSSANGPVPPRDGLAGQLLHLGYVSRVFLVVEPCKIRFLVQNTIPRKQFRILLYNGYHSFPNKMLLMWILV